MFSPRWLPSIVAVSFLALLTALFAIPASLDSQNDYLEPELRRRVETLKREAGQPTTDLDVLGERLSTLWAWGNAYSRTGGPLPPDLPTTVSRNVPVVRGLETAGIGASPAQVSTMIDHLVRDLKLKDEQPGAIGGLRLEPPGPFRAGEAVTVKQIYTVGELPLAEGARLVLGGGSQLAIQADRPAAEGFVGVRSSKDGARFELETDARWRGVHLNRGSLTFRLSGASLEPGETVTVTYGDTSAGSPGFRLQPHSNDRVLLPLYLDPAGDGVLLTPSWPSFEVVGEPEIVQVNAVAPSVVKTGEAFSLAVRCEDRFRNLSSGKAPAFRLELDGEPVRDLAPGPALQVVNDLRIPEPGTHRYRVRSLDGSLVGTSPPIWVTPAVDQRILWGDLHGHTGFAEGQGSAEGYFLFGRDVARLDFLSLSEHDIWMDDFEWETLQRLTAEYLERGTFTPILGYEWTARNQLGGHHNVYFRTPQDRSRVPLQSTADLAELYAGLRRLYEPDEVLVVPHAHQAGDWNRSAPDIERLAEITSGHGTFEFFAQKYLANGYRLGFVGASDNHTGHPGYSGTGNRQLGGLTAVLARDNTPEALFEALRERRTYATTGERILLEADFSGRPMGGVLAAAEKVRVESRAAGTAPIDAIDVVKNGEVVYRRSYQESSVRPDVWVRVELASSTEVFSRANPRGSRPWSGTLSVTGADLLEVREPWFRHPLSFDVEPRPETGEIRFSFLTRGRGKSLLLHLGDATPTTELRLELDASRERPPSPGAPDRPLAALPAARISVQLQSLEGGAKVEELRVVRNVDHVTFELLGSVENVEQAFSFTDLTPAQKGDYYYVRVHQIDGAMAWSSPVWVGAEP